MFLSSGVYLKHVSDLIASSDELSIAVAFWGTGAVDLIRKANGKPVRIICNLTSGGTNPKVISEIKKLPAVSLRWLDTLHAKVILGNRAGIVGSANFSINGLQLNGESTTSWHEAGILTKDLQEIGQMRAWFDQEWELAENINNEALERAAIAWDARRVHRPVISDAKSILDLPLHELQDRNIYIALWRHQASKEAKKCFENIEEAATVKRFNFGEKMLEKLDFFEEWDDLPKNAKLISIEYTEEGKCKVGGCVCRIPELDTNYEDENGASKKIQIVIDQVEILNRHFTNQDCKNLKKLIQPHLTALWKKAENDGLIMSLHDFFLSMATPSSPPMAG